MLLATIALCEEQLTCWELCSRRCRARFGALTDSCLKACNCTCDKDCDNLCLKFNLGALCRLKCGCFESANVSVEDEDKAEIKKSEDAKTVIVQNVTEEKVPCNKTLNDTTCDPSCTTLCLKHTEITIKETTVCLQGCKCQQKHIEKLLMDVKFGKEDPSFGKIRWGTFMVVFFVLATIASGSFTVYKRYNLVKEFQKEHRVLNEGGAVYHRLI